MLYYNEWNRYSVQWLRNLIAAGVLPKGDVDERDIRDVQGSDLKGYTQIHLFAGVGGWPLALELAGWPSDAPVWTGSPPCQPFSKAGRGGGTSDPRHLWPEFARLIGECRPPVVFGEQVASTDGRVWLAGVRVDLEAMAYAVGAAGLCAASVGAPHIRSRLWWVAESSMARWPQASTGPVLHSGDQPEQGRSAMDNGVADALSETVRARPGGMGGETPAESSQGLQRQWAGSNAGHRSADNGVADADMGRWKEQRQSEQAAEQGTPRNQPDRYGLDGQFINAKSGMGNADESRPQGLSGSEPAQHARVTPWQAGLGYWDDAEFIPCLDGKSRRVEPGAPPLVNGFPHRVDQLRAYGNAIVPQVAAVFIEAYLDSKKLPAWLAHGSFNGGALGGPNE